jgi:protein SCO1
VLHPRLRLVLTALTACAIAAVAGVWIADANREEPARPAAQGFAGALRPTGARAPALTGLRDQDGRPLAMPARTTVMTFVYSTCEDTCPTLVQTIRGALDDLGSDVPVIGVSVDPANDTPARAKRFLLEQRMTGRMRFALGDVGALERVWSAYGIQPQHDGKEHSAYVVLVDGAGRQRLGYPVSALSPEGLAADIAQLERVRAATRW